MTIEELLDTSVEALEKMTDEELMKYFEPYLEISKPAERIEMPLKKSKPSLRKQMEELAKQHNVKI
tara:strand:- start:2531 stop:2728 length:198 start_codon:yes stop_codon:yes gene_type:complete